MRLKELPKFDRPREKFLEKGPDALADGELLAILLGSGIKGTNVKVLSQKILKKFGNNLLNTKVEDLTQIQGIGEAKALQIASMLALAGRLYDKQNAPDNLVLTAQDAIALVSDLKEKKQEHIVCLYLNARNALLKKEIISIGTLDKSIIHPREIFAPGLEMRASGVILAHNHPSGDPKPSEQDKQVAKRIIEAGKLMGVNVVDFLIIAKNGAHSILGDIKDTKLTDTEYVAEGEQSSLFDLLVDANQAYFSGNGINTIAPSIKKGALRFIDLFAGIGGFHMAFHNIGAECVFVSEWDSAAQKTYRHNFYDTSPGVFDLGNFVGDITKIDSKNIPDFDILTAGFPCQPFSIAGYKKGFNDEGRGNLFFDIVRILKDKKPKAFLLENVKNLKTHDSGRTIKIIREELKKIGYAVDDKVLNTMEYGNIPQNRERIYIVGFLDKKMFDKFSFPEKTPLKKTIYDCLEKNVGGEYYYNGKNLYSELRNEVKNKGTVYQWRRKYVRENKSGACPTLTANMGMGGHNVPIVLDDKGIRKITPRECANFQGFPKDFKLPDLADSHLYKQFGNSVSVPVVERIALNIKKALT